MKAGVDHLWGWMRWYTGAPPEDEANGAKTSAEQREPDEKRASSSGGPSPPPPSFSHSHSDIGVTVVPQSCGSVAPPAPPALDDWAGSGTSSSSSEKGKSEKQKSTDIWTSVNEDGIERNPDESSENESVHLHVGGDRQVGTPPTTGRPVDGGVGGVGGELFDVRPGRRTDRKLVVRPSSSPPPAPGRFDGDGEEESREW